MHKKVILILALAIILSINVQAANISNAYKWLDNQKPTDVYSASLGALALNEVNGGKAYFDFLTSKKSKDNCYPDPNCKGKETAAAILALTKSSANTDFSLEWLNSHQQVSLNGEWLLQIKTESSGNCDISYKTTKKKINVEKGFIKSELCSTPSTFFNLGKCLESNLLSKPPVTLDIKCDFSGDISSLYKDQDIYYLNDDVNSGQTATIKINNGNYDNFEDTLFINWVLKKVNYETFNNLIYLRKNYQENNVRANAFLFLITNKPAYSNKLSELQKQDGSFGSVQDTAISVLALNDDHQTQADSARKWLDSKQDIEGSWNKNIIDTAFVLYGAGYSKTSVDLNNKQSETEKPINKETTNCNKDNTCDYNENSLTCPSDCICGDKICDNSESFSICPGDCKKETETEETILCGNNIIDSPEQCDGASDTSCPGQCDALTCQCKTETKSSSGFFKYFILFIILIIGLFFAYKKFGANFMNKFKSKQKSVPQRPTFTRQVEQKSEFKGPLNLLKSISDVKTERKSKVEEDLENSLREAKKILEK